MINKLAKILIIFFAFAGIFIYFNQYAACKRPLEYDVGAFDGRFGVSKENFIKTTKEAEDIWEKTTGRNLFAYKSGAKLKINLIYDNRQDRTVEANRSKEEIGLSQAQYDSMVLNYKAMAANYERELKSYNERVVSFERRLDDYNKRIAEINARGGAKPQEYKELENERKSLESEKASLDSQRIELNKMASELNNLGDSINYTAKQLNIEVNIHNERFGDAKEFEQGEYNGQIDVYQFDGISDLRLVLAHELGHALGIDHVENPLSVMYYLMDKQNVSKPALSSEDLKALNNLCRFHIPKLQELINSF